ncbi:Disintegrin and metallo proteinase domain-containing protein B [Cladorrhinum sp. PSN332]|nr:Disintegrin and metallo proteinase domain-containing protein B [Cladorrhinum sp. PSN332]
MLFTKAFAAVLIGAGLLLQDAIAHSVQRNPLSYVSRIDDVNIETPSHRVHAHSAFAVTFLLHNRKQPVRLTLEPSIDIFSVDATIQHVAADGSIHKVEPVERQKHKVFKGDTFVRDEDDQGWVHAGWARISVKRDGEKPVFEGAFSILSENHHVQTLANYRELAVPGDPILDEDDDDTVVVWRDTDVRPPTHQELKRDLSSAPSCGSDRLLYNRDEKNLVYRAFTEQPAAPEQVSPWLLSPRAIFGRQNFDGFPGGSGAGVNLANSIGSTAGCPTTKRVALIGIATDCTYTARFSNKQAVQDSIVNLVNTASKLYEDSFNITLALQNLTISEADCPASPPTSAPWNTNCGSTTIEQRLSQFSQWRGQWTDSNAYWTLLTTCSSGNAVGLAWLGAVCQQGAQRQGNNETTASANVVVRTSTEWLVFAHETGHTFGAVHDCDPVACADGSVDKQQCCPFTRDGCSANGQFIMHPSTGSGINSFSQCTIGNICSFLGRSPGRTNCLNSNRGVLTFTGAQCGNGIVEAGEDCDCGGTENCAGNPCCNPTTCKFTTGSQCDFSSDECCNRQCTFQPQGFVCRASSGPCDPQEVCSGNSSMCPADQSAPDGQSCSISGASNLACASGRCTSRDLQCKTIMGVALNSNDTTSCSNKGCMMACKSPMLTRWDCATMGQQFFLDGTSCEGGGKCKMGNCQGASLWNQIVEWINDNKQIFIPVACVVGGLLLLAILSCIWSCCCSCRRRASKKSNVRQSMPPPPYYAPMPAMRGPTGPDARWEPMRANSYRYA